MFMDCKAKKKIRLKGKAWCHRNHIRWWDDFIIFDNCVEAYLAGYKVGLKDGKNR